jgi:ABC-type uncharacterized transport system permease subunit
MKDTGTQNIMQKAVLSVICWFVFWVKVLLKQRQTAVD